MSTFKIRSISVLLLLLIGFSGVAQAKLPFAVDGKALPSLADMLEKITPAVVNITTETAMQGANLKDPVYRHYFGKRIPAKKKKTRGTGSGIIVDAEVGYIVTNAHVIEGAGKIIVTLTDKRQFYAEITGVDTSADIAVIRILPERLTAMPMANGKKVRVGDFVVAIGNPYGLGQSVSSGIVSALGRTGLGIEHYEDFIQTDAPINPGNSGGALVNLRGELIGINTAILGNSNGGNVGIGFAIPVSMVVNIKEQIVQNGQVERGQLGIEIQDVRPSLVKEFKLKDGQGALISGVAMRSPAELAGIKEGDVITRVNGVTVRNSSNLKSMIANMRMGAKVDMEYVRDGLVLKSVATVGEVNSASYTKGQEVIGAKPVTPSSKTNKPRKKYYQDPWNF
jgi:serine protease Do/serine protease DegQ